MSEPADFTALINRVKQGEQEAAAELVRRYEPEIRRYIRLRMTSCSIRRFVDSFDVCQSVLGRFFQCLAVDKLDISDPANLQAILRTIAKNRVYDVVSHAHAARRDVRRVAPAGDEPLAVLADSSDTPSKLVAAEELVAAIYEKLPSEVRQLVEARMHGSNWEELAVMASSTPEAVRKQVNRAIQRAADALGLVES